MQGLYRRVAKLPDPGIVVSVRWGPSCWVKSIAL
jgi:hypothetical protein